VQLLWRKIRKRTWLFFWCHVRKLRTNGRLVYHTWAANSFLIEAGTGAYLAFVISTIILFMPLTFRISRLLWLNFFVSFDKNKATYKTQKQ
jgi:hypothetical protein